MAATLGNSIDVTRLHRAIAIDPGDPLLHYTLGIVQLPGSAAANPPEAVREMREAIRLSPNSAVYWSGLGRACYASGDQPCAGQAFVRATELAPSKPRFAWEAAVNAVLEDRRNAAIVQLKRYLDLKQREAAGNGLWETSVPPPGASETFDLLWRGFRDPALIWRELLSTADVGKAESPKLDLALKLAYLDFLCERDQFALAAEYWTEIAWNCSPSSVSGPSVLNCHPERSKGSQPHQAKTGLAGGPGAVFPQAKPYLERLISSGRFEQAAAVWRYLLQTGAIVPPVSDSVNLVFNGSFERDPLNIGFDWRIQQQPYLDLSFVNREGQSDVAPASTPAQSNGKRETGNGQRVLRLDFAVPQNSEYEPAYQLVSVTPGQAYLVTANIRSEEISSDSGPRLRVTDPQCRESAAPASMAAVPSLLSGSAAKAVSDRMGPKRIACLNATTDAAIRTSAWHEVSVRFTAGPETNLVKLSIWRPRSRAFPMEISGRAWFADIALRPAE